MLLKPPSFDQLLRCYCLEVNQFTCHSKSTMHMTMQVNCCMMNDCLGAAYKCRSASQSNAQGTCALLCRTVLEIKAKTAFRPLKTGSDLWCWLGRKCLPHQKILPQYFAQVLLLVTAMSAPKCDKTSERMHYCMCYCAVCHVCIIQCHDTTTNCTSKANIIQLFVHWHHRHSLMNCVGAADAKDK